MSGSKPFIVGIGGTTKPGSSTEQALGLAMAACEKAGADVRMFGGEFLAGLQHYSAEAAAECAKAREFVEAVRCADGLVIASPGYHGTISGLIKNAIDYLEETAKDERVYLDGLPVGLVVTAYGWQAGGSTLATLRSMVHALRGWPTPFGAAINSVVSPFRNNVCTDEGAAAQLESVGRQVVEFTAVRRRDTVLEEEVSAA